MKRSDKINLLRKAAAARLSAYSPYSGFRVGACLLADDGDVAPGCNVENASYGLTTCAERTALFTAIAAGRRSFSVMAVVADGKEPAWPCGACRQVLAEFCSDTLLVLTAGADDIEGFREARLGHLLPHTFLMEKQTRLDIREKKNNETA
jgi:cytidine deaminase